MSAPGGEPRVLALEALLRVLHRGESLDRALAETADAAPPRDRALARALAYGVLRDYTRLDTLAGQLLERPLKSRDRDLKYLILMGIFQLDRHRTPDYAVVSQTVDVAQRRGKRWAKGLINAVLRNFLRQRESLPAQLPDRPEIRYSTPEWMVRRLQTDWPEHWEPLLAAGQQPGPMVLRVDLNRTAREAYLEELQAAGLAGRPPDCVPSAVELSRPGEVGALPGFDTGRVSVQDAAAQSAAYLLAPREGDRVLDACAAPGGKTMHLLEYCPDLDQVLAVDIDAARLEHIERNRARAGAPGGKLALLAADAADYRQWWDGRPFQRVLLDAPCSGSGVIRRHPDIKWLRRESDLESLADRQARLLDGVWPTVAPGGYLLYCTCSVFDAENAGRVAPFLERTPDARAVPLAGAVAGAIDCRVGVQILTGDDGRDGFYYALIQKAA